MLNEKDALKNTHGLVTLLAQLQLCSCKTHSDSSLYHDSIDTILCLVLLDSSDVLTISLVCRKTFILKLLVSLVLGLSLISY